MRFYSWHRTGLRCSVARQNIELPPPTQETVNWPREASARSSFALFVPSDAGKVLWVRERGGRCPSATHRRFCPLFFVWEGRRAHGVEGSFYCRGCS